MKKGRTISTILFKAAETMERGYFSAPDALFYCCPMINRVAFHSPHRASALIYFGALYKPRGKRFSGGWFPDSRPENTETRILALYFAAHMAYSEGL